MGVPVVEEGALAEKSDPEDQESVGNESEAASEDEDQQDEEESDSDSYSIDGTEDEHLEKLLLFYTDVPPKSVEEEEEEEEEDDEEEADRESDNGGYDEVEPDTESEADASSCGDDEVSGTPTEEAPDSSESDQSQPETVTAGEDEAEWATVLDYIRARQFKSAAAALPLDQQPVYIKGEPEVATYLTSHTVDHKPLAAGKTAKKLSVCRLSRRLRNDRWEEIEPCNQGFLVASSGDGCTLTRHINNVHFGVPR